MNILHVKYAVEIAKMKSISKAAENLYTTQPNLSRAVKELEESLGITIFKRTSKGISITSEGEEFLQHAERIISQLDEIEEIYKNHRQQKQRFSVCVPRASYISYALAEFAKNIETDIPAEIFYEETNSMSTINRVAKDDCNLGIIRYQEPFDKYFRKMFSEKKLIYETIVEFNYVILMSKNNPLANNDDIELSELSEYIEIAHGDTYVPSIPLIDVKKAEFSEFVDKRIFVCERASQFTLLEKVPVTFMWTSPVPDELIKKYNLVQRTCKSNLKKYKDILIYRRGYQLTSLDDKFITELCRAKRKFL